MNTKRLIIAGTMAATITMNGALWGDKANAQTKQQAMCACQASVSAQTADDQKDDFREVLGISSDEEVFQALYNGQSLADIAASRGRDIQAVIDLQTAELAGQLEQRLAEGNLSLTAYLAHQEEIKDIVVKSVYGKQGNRTGSITPCGLA